MSVKIGITERGDATVDMSWVDKFNSVNGAILITKNVSDEFIDAVLPFKDKVVLHAACTGYGGTVLEPFVPEWMSQLAQVDKLVKAGFDKNKVVIRVDPIIPTSKGCFTAETVIKTAFTLYDFRRFRVSVLDMYPHVRERFRRAGLPLPYGENFQASDEQFSKANSMIAKLLSDFPDIQIECCAENKLANATYTGCVGPKEFELLNIQMPENITCGHQRKGCMCVDGVKTELLDCKHRCKHGCLYCYWKD